MVLLVNIMVTQKQVGVTNSLKIVERCVGHRGGTGQVHQKHGCERRLTSDPTYKGRTPQHRSYCGGNFKNVAPIVRCF
jgi:hypothetical protein